MLGMLSNYVSPPQEEGAMKWVCKFCMSINAQFAYKCHNCGRGRQ